MQNKSKAKSPPPILYELGRDFYVVDYHKSVLIWFSVEIKKSLLVHLN